MNASRQPFRHARLACALVVGVVLAMLEATRPGSMAQPQRLAAPLNAEAQTMKIGRWEGEYIDVEGHRARVQFVISETGARISGEFELVLSTEDKAERYRGALTGTASGDSVTLKLQMARGEPMVCSLMLREPAAYAEQAVFGVVEPVPAMKLGGGTLVAWRFRSK